MTKPFVAKPQVQLQPDQKPTYFLDRNLGCYKVADILRQAGANVAVHDDHFPPDMEDAEWLSALRDRNWVLLTLDRHILTRPTEIAALIAACIHAFILKQSSRDMTGDEIAQAFLDALPHMNRLAAKHTPPFLARVTPTGNVTEIEGYQTLINRLP